MGHQSPGTRIPQFSRVLISFAALCFLFAPDARCLASGPAVQRIVVATSIEALPQPLSDYFADMKDAVLERAIEPFGLWQREAQFKNRAQWYYVYLDTAAESNDPRARMQSAQEFPDEQVKARGLMRKSKVKRGGELPWALESMATELTRAFENGDRNEVAMRAGYLISFCTCAANPFHLTRDRHGEASGNLNFGRKMLGDSLYAHQDVGQRYGWELVRRFQHRYQSQIDPARFQYPLGQTARQMIFNTMLASLQDLGEFCNADRAILEKMNVVDETAFFARQDEYYELLDDAEGEATVEMLRRASRLAAALIYNAYEQAGSPNLNSSQPEPPTKIAAISQPLPDAQPESGTADNKDQENGASEQPAIRIASKSSKVFHLPTCSHVKRISDKNRVEYESEQAALASGKRRCNSCLGKSD